MDVECCFTLAVLLLEFLCASGVGTDGDGEAGCCTGRGTCAASKD